MLYKLNKWKGFSGLGRWGALLLALVLPATATAAEHAVDSGDTAWLLAATALVLFMTIPGLSLFYAGLVRSKNVLSVMMHCFSITCAVSILWVVVGYSLAFSDGGGLNSIIGGLSNFLLMEVGRSSIAGTIPETLFVIFQMTFAIITPALIVGAFAERMRFPAMLTFSLLWVLLVYCPIAHMVWGGGWLGNMGIQDFAGGLVVHLTAGASALIAALVLKPRYGFPNTPMPPHNLAMAVSGACMLWVGWFGFNGGSALTAGADASMAILVTHISAASASLMWVALEWIRHGKPSVLGIVTGMVAGLGSITPASGTVGPIGALIIGSAAGFVCFFATYFFKRNLKIDDSLDVFPVHGVGGALGTILLAFLMSSAWGGVGYGEDSSMGQQFIVQLIGVVAVLLWTVVVTWICLRVTGVFIDLRAEESKEIEGLDINDHEEKGYSL